MSHTLEERCRQLIIQRKFEQCQKEIETAMAENPHCAIPHNLMGILLEKESNHVQCAEAISDQYGIIHLGKIPSASAFFEKVIHFSQMKKYGVVMIAILLNVPHVKLRLIESY